MPFTEWEKRTSKSQASDAETGTQRDPTGRKNRSEQGIGQLWRERERPREAFSYMEVHSHDARMGLCLEMCPQVLLWIFFPTERLSQLLGFHKASTVAAVN